MGGNCGHCFSFSKATTSALARSALVKLFPCRKSSKLILVLSGLRIRGSITVHSLSTVDLDKSHCSALEICSSSRPWEYTLNPTSLFSRSPAPQARHKMAGAEAEFVLAAGTEVNLFTLEGSTEPPITLFAIITACLYFAEVGSLEPLIRGVLVLQVGRFARNRFCR